jgi:hypothetical protein
MWADVEHRSISHFSFLCVNLRGDVGACVGVSVVVLEAKAGKGR